ncbi:hypothetical protein DVH24_000343 [Malus domestica]|uniref:Uncharacterized protein n=1 Tax=Malus domestica TaxID=3750 RepID=A0A498J354_MALDO|nr:hypothetical protein DVH24_000343 [Malus domestica]
MKVSGNPTLSSLFRLHTPPSNPPFSHTSLHPIRLSCSFRPTKPPKPPSLSASTSPPARDRKIQGQCWAPSLQLTSSGSPKIFALATSRTRRSSPTKSLTTPFTRTGSRKQTQPLTSFRPPSYGGSKPIKNPNFLKSISPFHRYIHSAQAQAVDFEDSEQEEERVQRERAEVR